MWFWYHCPPNIQSVKCCFHLFWRLVLIGGTDDGYCFAGMPLHPAKPAKPSFAEYVYADEQVQQGPPKCELILSPPEAATPRPGVTYPQSPTWTLKADKRFPSGFIYAADYLLEWKASLDRDRMKKIVTPPNIAPILRDGRYVAEQVPGMVHMVPGIPFVYFLDADPERPMTFGCVQTLESLEQYPDFQIILDTSVRLAKLTWGCKEHGNTPAIPRLCSLAGLTRNDRSAGMDPVIAETTRDGSYSLASTVMQGNGQGIVEPTAQVNTTEGTSHIGAVLQNLHTLYRHVFPKCVSKLEFELLEFHSRFNNVFSFGGLEPNGTSCQLNVSSTLKGILRARLGDQGDWHVDSGDDLTAFTLFTLLLHVGPSKCSIKTLPKSAFLII